MSAAEKNNLWQKLTKPHPSITDIEQRRQSQLLASFILVLMAAFSLMVVQGLTSAQEKKDYVSSLILLSNVGILGLEFYLNRTGRYKLSAYLFTLMAFVFIHILSLTSFGALSRMYYIALMILVSAILLPLRITFFLTLASFIIQILFSAAEPTTSQVSNIGPLSFTLVIGLIVLVFIQHRNGLERERQAELQAANTALRESEALLEKRVAERTRDLEIAADVSKKVATELVLDKLLSQLVERTRDGFNLYSVAIFLLDEDQQILRYEAGTGEAGEQQKPEKKHFRMNGSGLVPRAARSRQVVLVNDVQSQADYFANPHLPATRAELCLPMLLGDQLIGVLDLQSEQVGRFADDDLRVMVSLSEQLAVAVQNAHLYDQQVKIAEELRAVDTMKSQFLASMSHELRTPLNAILNFTEFVALGMMGPVNEKQVDALQKALDSGRHLLSLINDVLDITKIEAGMMKLFVEDNINLNEEFFPIIATAQTLLQGKPVAFVQDIDENLPFVSGEKRRIRQILLNLISNAAKFTEEGSITLSVKNRGDEVLFAVIDTGPGIAPEEQEVIFEPFIQTETGIQHAGGTGLGLPISKRLAEAHGGRLWVESQPGEGAAFYVMLPVQVQKFVESQEEEAEIKHV